MKSSAQRARFMAGTNCVHDSWLQPVLYLAGLASVGSSIVVVDDRINVLGFEYWAASTLDFEIVLGALQGLALVVLILRA